MRIIESTHIDLIEPFPLREAKRVFGWLHAYKNIVENDLSPKTPESFEEFMINLLPNVRSFGVIDRDNVLGFRHEAPLIGMVVFEPYTIWNSFIHLASTRRAWGSGFMDEAIDRALTDIFETTPTLLRVTGLALANNGPVKGLARRLGWQYEGKQHDAILQDGEPRDLVQFCVTRRAWVLKNSTPPPEVEVENNDSILNNTRK